MEVIGKRKKIKGKYNKKKNKMLGDKESQLTWD